MAAIKTLFWLSAGFVLYAYAGYPVFIWLIASLFPARRRGGEKPSLPKVSLLISAYNEEAVIEDKLINSFSIQYPKDLLEIMVVSDGSDDRTNDIVKSYEKQGVVLNYHEGRIGKTACLNHAVASACGDIIVFSDANSFYDRDAIKNLVANFTDERIGFASGYTKYAEQGVDEVAASVGIYAKIEKMTKKSESRIGSCVGADGAIFAIRRRLYKPLRNTDINDLVIPLQIIGQGFRGVLEENASCVEKTAGSQKGEFGRQVRITNRALRAIYNNAALLNPLQYGFFSFELFSHKIAKFLTPFFLLSLACCNVALMNSGTAYNVLLLAQLICYISAWVGHSRRRSTVFSKLNSLCFTFVAMNAAILSGWVQFARGRTYTTWSPAKR
jgi:cellulose synthase/poly-beta-1,6-N-acetylglucosamine synthase-like glycosyltransferase